ncbi:hypothetical protein RM545_12360 [Zunongwangia sp. F260]|uniref:Right handed beta helix domain-containing protein n=1 Tax=Autumnicola lenta TaxID=3075593 RepID=A0ABU3CMA8_9FLAO|nr:right-handed parallel beta-helix repeat-containing protein [Zunongwangia sp. F260]MDT0647484.1 hypothetical protein [Zunongwangia sp. F260]
MVLLTFLTLSCSKDEPEIFSKELTEKINPGTTSIYKGIFATYNSKARGIFDLKIPAGVKNLSSLKENAVGKITTHTGEIYEAQLVSLTEENKSHDFKLEFDSQDFSFTFNLDDNEEPVISNVVFKDQSGSIVASESTEHNSVTPITGTYQCTNCEEKDSINGIPLNNDERIFNMMLTTADGTSKVTIQAVLGILLDTQVVIEQTCSTSNDYTICEYTNGIYTNSSVEWNGIHRFKNESSGDPCSTISGDIAFKSIDQGIIEGFFSSDSDCPSTTYYVSAEGDDSRNGLSSNSAWKNISMINDIDLQPGDQVLFEGGQVHNGNLYLDSNDANNPANPVLIGSYGTGRATINAGDEFGIYAYNTAGIKVNNLVVAGSGAETNTKDGITFYNDLPGDVTLDFVEVTDCEIYGFRKSGITIGAYNGNSGFSNVLIENNKVHDCLDKGITSYGYFSSTKTGYAHSNIIVRNCEVYNITGYSKNSHSGNGIVLSDVQNSVIEQCTVYNCGSGNTNCGGPVGIWYWDADQVTIQYCEAYNISSGTGCDGGGFDLDGGVTNGIMQYNYSHDNDGAGYLIGQFTGARPMKNITVRYNISQNDAATNGGSVYLFNGNEVMQDIYVYNNTLYLSEKSSNTAAANIKYSSWYPVKDNINFYNNILYADNGADLVSIPSNYDGKFAGNLYYSSGSFQLKFQGTYYNSLEDFRSTGNEIHNEELLGYEGKPLLNNAGKGSTIGFGNDLTTLEAYKLQTTSPAINEGVELPFSSGNHGFFGNKLSENTYPDIGAHVKLIETTKATQGKAPQLTL